MSNARLEVLVWVLIYGGLLMVGLGLALPHTVNTLGWSLIAIGAVVAVVGVVLIWVRSRRPATPPKPSVPKETP